MRLLKIKFISFLEIMTDLIPTISPENLRQGAVNTVYAGIGGALISRYGLGGSVFDGVKYGAGTYVTVASTKAIYDVLSPDSGVPLKKGESRRPISANNPINKGNLGDDLQEWWGLVDKNAPPPPTTKPIPLMPVTYPALPIQTRPPVNLGSPPARGPSIPPTPTQRLGDTLNGLWDEVAKASRN